MKPDKNNDQALFDSLRQSPAELNREEVASMIKAFPPVPTGPNHKNNWTDFFSLKNVIMISIPVSIAISLLVIFGIQDDVPPISLTKEEAKTITLDEAPTKLIEETTLDLQPAPSASKPTTDKPMLSQPLVKQLTKQATPVTKKKTLVEPTDKPLAPPTVKNQKKEVAPQKSLPHTNRIRPFRLIVQTPVPEMSGIALKRLKKVLYKNLQADGIISTKSTFVEMDLPGKEIFVNGERLDANLFLKYSTLTQKIGTGADRKIKMNEEYIKAGDFTEEGFRGSGMGTFRENFIAGDQDFLSKTSNEITKEEAAKNALILQERKELNTFTQAFILNNAEERKGLFSVNLKYERCQELHQLLYRMLLEDQLLTSAKDFAFIQLPENKIRINGQELSDQHYSKYATLFANFKIKSAPQRAISLSKHTISIGDFVSSSFTGTTVNFISD